jgi:hypothetical protein
MTKTSKRIELITEHYRTLLGLAPRIGFKKLHSAYTCSDWNQGTAGLYMFNSNLHLGQREIREEEGATRLSSPDPLLRPHTCRPQDSASPRPPSPSSRLPLLSIWRRHEHFRRERDVFYPRRRWAKQKKKRFGVQAAREPEVATPSSRICGTSSTDFLGNIRANMVTPIPLTLSTKRMATIKKWLSLSPRGIATEPNAPLKEPCVDFDPSRPSIHPPTFFLIYIRTSRELVSSHSTLRHTTLEPRSALLPRKTQLVTEEEAS